MHRSTIPLAPHGNPVGMFPTQNFWQRAPTWKKAAYVAGGVAAVGGTWMVIRWARRPKPFASLSPQCNDFALADRNEINAAIRPLVESAAQHGPVDPFFVTTQFLQRYAPACHSYPDPARNPGEAQLYVQAFAEVIRIMEEQRLLSPEQRAYFLEMVSVWGKSQGVSDAALPSMTPPTAGVI